MLNYDKIKEIAQKVLEDFSSLDEADESAPILDEIDIDILSSALAEALNNQSKNEKN